MVKKIGVGTSSGIKLEAIKLAFEGWEVLGVDNFISNVPEQPIGKEQTIEGAKFRAEYARKFHPTADVWIGIENGMFKDSEDKWVDAGAIVILEKGEFNVIWTDQVYIPEDMEKGPNGEWSKLKDPHIVITGKPRALFISEAIIKFRKSRNL